MIGSVINGAMKGFGQLLADGKLRAVLWKALGISLLAIIVALFAAWLAVDYILLTYVSWLPDWLIGPLEGAAVLSIMGVAWILFPAIVTGFAGMFLDDAAKAVEMRHYPADPAGTPPPFWPGMVNSLKFAGLVMAINLLLMPLYLIGLFFPPLLLIIYVINAFLLGREYFELVAFRHMTAGSAFETRRRNSTYVWLGGAAIAFGFTVPFVNLIVPVVGVAMMVHMFKHLGVRGKLATA